ncbi:hypothetical protein T484DRAFT_1798963 [Baffinella frigidus]|nr:hypothetical protein T484DRAFT_1798963 [Cryptophyta sp. CCMP2293]
MGGRKDGAARGAHQLPVEGIYELAARPHVVKVVETPQAEWDEESRTAWVVAERGKHLKVMGHRRKVLVTKPEGGTEEAARRPGGIAAGDPTEEDAGDGAARSTGGGASATGLVLHAEEALLLVQQGLLLLRRRGGDTEIMSAEELQALAVGEGGGRVSLRLFRAYACLREHGFVVLRASSLPPDPALPRSGGTCGGGEAREGGAHLGDGGARGGCLAEGDGGGGIGDGEEGREPLLAAGAKRRLIAW